MNNPVQLKEMQKNHYQQKIVRKTTVQPRSQGNSNIGSSLLSSVGNTPLIPLQRVINSTSADVQVLGKAEWFNPGGSVKDRPALNIIRKALSTGQLLPGMRLLDSTSGNMGIAYATFGAAMDVPITLAVPSNASPERISILKALGAELILTDALEGSDGSRLIAAQLAKREPKKYFYANQYKNPANWQAHYRSTGPEIIDQTDGKITHFIAGLGTSGTLVGVSRYLRQYNPDIEIIAIQPDSPFHGLEGLKHMQSSIKPEIFDPTLIDRTILIKTEDAYDMTLQLTRKEGLFVGVSSGAAVAASQILASELDEAVIVTIFPDAGYKYLSDKALWGQK